MNVPIKVAPSILSCDFSRLAEEIKAVERAGADLLHVDIMDGHFVPNLTIGPVVVKDIRKATKLPLDVHLMIEQPDKFCDAFLAAGADMITAHIEATTPRKLESVRAKVRARGAKFGLSINPPTPFAKLEKLLKLADFVLVMSVNPGFGVQEFIPAAVAKIQKLRSVFSKDIAVDGGINDKTGRIAAQAGANILAAGSYIFKTKDYAETIRSLKCAL